MLPRNARSLCAGALLGLVAGTATAEPEAAGVTAELRGRLHQALERGLVYLEQNQRQDGSFEDNIGISGLAASALLRAPQPLPARFQRSSDRALAYIVTKVQDDGGIYVRDLPNYHTAVGLKALVDSRKPEYGPLVARAQQFLTGLQAAESVGYEESDKFYGGIGYGSDLRPDMANMEYALSALKDSGLPRENPLWDKAIKFLQRSQNSSETNDASWAGNDGGFVYYPGFSYADGAQGTHSYGSMTYAGLLSYGYADVAADDPRVLAARRWIRDHYDVDQNPGMGAKTLYYYYLVFAKALAAYGEDIIVDARGVRHDWRRELGAKLLELQHPEGYWVNEDPDWMQNNKVLVTSFTAQAIEYILAE